MDAKFIGQKGESLASPIGTPRGHSCMPFSGPKRLIVAPAIRMATTAKNVR
jgi:hypothetical protein